MFIESVVVLIRQTNHFRVTRALRPLFLIDTHYFRGVRRLDLDQSFSFRPLFIFKREIIGVLWYMYKDVINFHFVLIYSQMAESVKCSNQFKNCVTVGHEECVMINLYTVKDLPLITELVARFWCPYLQSWNSFSFSCSSFWFSQYLVSL